MYFTVSVLSIRGTPLVPSSRDVGAEAGRSDTISPTTCSATPSPSGMDKESGLSDLDLRWRRRSGVTSPDQHLVGLLNRERILPYGQTASLRPGGTTTIEDVTEAMFPWWVGYSPPFRRPGARRGPANRRAPLVPAEQNGCRTRFDRVRHRLELRTGGTS